MKWSEVWNLLGLLLNWQNVQGKALNVGTTEVKLVGTTPLRQRAMLSVTNLSASTVYLGTTGVTTATGFPLVANATKDMLTAADVYAIAAGATNDVRIFEAGKA